MGISYEFTGGTALLDLANIPPGSPYQNTLPIYGAKSSTPAPPAPRSVNKEHNHFRDPPGEIVVISSDEESTPPIQEGQYRPNDENRLLSPFARTKTQLNFKKSHGSTLPAQESSLGKFTQKSRRQCKQKSGSDEDSDFRPEFSLQNTSAVPGPRRESLKRTSADRPPCTLHAPQDIPGNKQTKPPRKIRKWRQHWENDDFGDFIGGPPPSVDIRGSNHLSGPDYELVQNYPPILTEKERQDRIVFEAHLEDLDGPPVHVVNFVDGSTPTTHFRFINQCVNGNDVHPLDEEWIVPCECKHKDGRGGGCKETDSCGCNLNSDADLFPYHGRGHNKGCLTAQYSKSGDHIYECTPLCPCQGKCGNVKVQLGRKIPLEIFKTQDRGWGLRSPMGLRRGEFIDTYRGERITDAEAERRGKERDAAGEHDKYFFDLDKFKPAETITRDQFLERFSYKLLWHRDLVRSGQVTIERNEQGEEMWANPEFVEWEQDGEGVVIDGRDMGGPTRWINHSCDPNCQIMTASIVHADRKVYHLAFFTTRPIQPYEELTFDYKGGTDGDIISDQQATELSRQKGYQIQRCRCKAENCRRYFFE